MKSQFLLILYLVLLLFVKYIAVAQPLGCGNYFAFSLKDENGVRINSKHPDFDSYTLILRLGTNENNGPNDTFGGYDTIQVGDKASFEKEHISDFNVFWQDQNVCYNMEYVELLVKRGNDSMYVEITGKLRGAFYFEDVIFTPGNKYFLQMYYPYNEQKYADKNAGNSNSFRFNFSDLKWFTVKPIENYTPFLVRSFLVEKEVFLWIQMQGKGAWGKSSDYIAIDSNIKNKTIALNFREIVIEKNHAYGRTIAGMGEPISNRLSLGELPQGRYKLQVIVGNKREDYWLTVGASAIDLVPINPQNAITLLEIEK